MCGKWTWRSKRGRSWNRRDRGIGEGLLIKKGEIIRKVKEDELLDALRNELEHWGE